MISCHMIVSILLRCTKPAAIRYLEIWLLHPGGGLFLRYERNYNHKGPTQEQFWNQNETTPI
jgi:hypothetical protein